MSEGIEYRQRVLVVGQTRSGKSELLNHLFGELRCQRLLLDTKGGEWTVPGVEPVSDVAAIDWREPFIHYVTVSDDLEEIDALFAAARRHRNLCICAHEAGDLCGFNAQRTPPNVSAYISKGGAHGLGLFVGSQRPVQMPVRAKTEAQHLFVLTPRMTDADLKGVAEVGVGVDAYTLGQMLDDAAAQYGAPPEGKYAFYWFTKGVGEPSVWEPLPQHVRDAIVIRRAEGVM